MTVMWLVGSKPIRSYVTRQKRLFRMFWLTANLWQLESILSSNDVMCHVLWRYLPSLPYQFSILILNTSRVDSPANSRCRLLSCLLAVLAMILANSLPASASSSWNGWNVLPFEVTTKTTHSCPQVWQFCCTIDVIFHISQSSSKFGWQ